MLGAMPETPTETWTEDDDALLQQLLTGQAQGDDDPVIPGGPSEDPGLDGRLDALLNGAASEWGEEDGDEDGGEDNADAWHDEHLDRVLAADLGFEDLTLDGIEDEDLDDDEEDQLDGLDELDMAPADPRMATDDELLEGFDESLAIPAQDIRPPPPPAPRLRPMAPVQPKAVTPAPAAPTRPPYTPRSELGSPLQSHVELLARRLAIPVELAERAGLTDPKVLKDPAALIQAAAQVGPKDPEAASALLAAAVLGQSEQGADPRLSTFLRLLASMISHSKASVLLGPEGSALRAQLMPNGWLYTIQSWPRSRYAWREGMTRLLEVGPEDIDRLHALDEITAMSGSEAEPVSVVIQDVWPPKPVTTILTLIGMIVTSFGLYREFGPKRGR